MLFAGVVACSCRHFSCKRLSVVDTRRKFPAKSMSIVRAADGVQMRQSSVKHVPLKLANFIRLSSIVVLWTYRQRHYWAKKRQALYFLNKLLDVPFEVYEAEIYEAFQAFIALFLVCFRILAGGAVNVRLSHWSEPVVLALWNMLTVQSDSFMRESDNRYDLLLAKPFISFLFLNCTYTRLWQWSDGSAEQGQVNSFSFVNHSWQKPDERKQQNSITL